MTKPINFLNRLALLQPVIWQEVKRQLPGEVSNPHYAMVWDYPQRKGKYFRPALFLMALELYGANWQNHIELAATLQLCEDWLLIHDDIEDKSTERRGLPTLNALYGNSLAINAGDVLHATMWKNLYDCLGKEHEEKKKLIFNEFAGMLKTTMEGQFEELWWIHNQKISLPYSAYYQMILKKTCSYTTVGPICLAGIIAGLSEKKIKSIEAWAIPFGKSFQICDDVLDITSPKSGKEQYDDIREGKRTLILLHLLTHCRPSEKQQIMAIYKKDREKKTNRDVQTIIKLLKSYGSIEFATSQARRLSTSALREFKHHTAEFPDTPAKSQIQEAIKFVVTRNH